MANDKLCFVIGAGASAHFGYPLGSELVEAMDKFLSLIRQAKGTYSSDDFIAAQNFLKEMKSYNPLNVDFYLKSHPKQQNIGKKLIEAVILYSQHCDVFKKSNYQWKWWKSGLIGSGDSIKSGAYNDRPSQYDNDNDFFPAWNWVKFIHHSIVANCEDADAVKNALKNIFVVTFNYDLSFEQALWGYFKTSKFADDIKFQEYLFSTFFKENIEHVYGHVVRRDANKEPITENYECEEFDSYMRHAYKIFECANGEKLNIIGADKSEKLNVKAKGFLEQAKHVYFLGYAFDTFNNQTIGLEKIFSNRLCPRNICYTNLGDGLICDSTVRSFLVEHGYTISPLNADNRIMLALSRTKNKKIVISKSTKNVYEALERDLNIPLTKKEPSMKTKEATEQLQHEIANA